MGDSSRTAEADRQLEDLVLLEQVHHLYAQLNRSTFGMIVAGSIMAYAMWDRVAVELLLCWVGVITVNQTWRLTRYLKFLNAPPPPQDARAWARHWAIGAGLSGTIWGSTAWFMFVPDSPGHQAFLAAALIGVTAGALALITIHKASFYAFVTPTLLPVAARLLYEGDRLHIALALACLVVFGTALLFGRTLNRKLTDSIHLRLRGEHLVRELEAERREAAGARAAAEAATRAKSEFLAATAHDIGGQTSLLQQDSGRIAAMARAPDEARVVRRFSATVSSLAEMTSNS